MKKRSLIPALAVALIAVSAIAAVVVQFDINDFGTSSPNALGWTSVSGASDDAETLTGTDGTRTLTVTTAGDGVDRDRGTTNFTTDPNLWRDLWFVRASNATASATITGLAANTTYAVKLWAYDKNSVGTRSATWTDPVSGNSATVSFDGNSAAPTSLDDYVTTINVTTDSSGKLTLNASQASGGSLAEPNIFLNAISVSTVEDSSALPVLEAEDAGPLGSSFATSTLAGATCISTTSNNNGSNPGSSTRVAAYTANFPAAGTYQLYARIYVGSGAFNDDSFFYASGFGSKSATTDSDWVNVNGLAGNGFTAADDTVTVGGGSAGTQVWKWVKFSTAYTVSAGALSQTFQIGSREDGLSLDKFVFAPSDVSMTVTDLDNGKLPSVEFSPNHFDGADGIAVHRFGERLEGRNLDGANPTSALTLISDSLYGLTLNGGEVGGGAMFKVDPDGANFANLSSFPDSGGVSHPRGGFTASGNVLYGASQTGGTNGTGAIFAGAPDGSSSVIYSFNSVSGDSYKNTGGANPCETLALAGGVLYGTASGGGANGSGTVYSVGTGGSGFTVLHDFTVIAPNTGANADGAQPSGGVILVGGKLYGTTALGGQGGAGVVFSMDINGGNYTVLRYFDPPDPQTMANATGAFPYGGLVYSNGVLYGTASAGGLNGRGAVFSVKTDGSEMAVLHDFPATETADGGNAEGASPTTGLTLSGNVLYGVTPAGGGGGTGTVFSVNISGANFRVIHHFESLAANGTNTYGAYPVAPVLRVGHTLYGTAFGGGPGASGTVFGVLIPVSTSLAVANTLSGGFDGTLTISGAPGSSYTVYGSADLKTWQPLGTVSSDADGVSDFQEFNLTSSGRFYKVTFEP